MSFWNRAALASAPLLAFSTIVGLGATAQAQEHLQKYQQQPRAETRGVAAESLMGIRANPQTPRQQPVRDLSRAVENGLKSTAIGPDQEARSNPAGAPPCSGGCDTHLYQAPNASNGIFSDASCDLCAQPQVLADQFVNDVDQDICSLNVWGGYFPGNTALSDVFTLIVHDDAAGLPGAVIYTESGVSATRVMTGNVLFGVDEWEYTVTPAALIPMLAGNTYWIELYNDTGAGTDDWFWEVGDETAPGLAGSGFAFEAPGVTWNFDTVNSFSLQVCTNGPVGPPECSGACMEYMNQPANQVNGLFSDDDCDICGTGIQVIAEQFVSDTDQDLCSFWLYGGYFPGNSTPADDFTLVVHEDDGAGLPGPVVYSETGLSTTRGMTGIVLFGVDEWQYEATPASPIPLEAGKTYWIEIFNSTVGNTDNWFWETGDLQDPPGLLDAAFSTDTAPGTTWNGTPADLSLFLCTSVPPPPLCAVGCDERMNQPANAVNGLFSDLGCDLCGTGQQSIAESVIFSVESQICDLTVRSGYFPSNTPLTDDITLIIHEDNAGLPGAVKYIESGIAATRTMTGNVLFGVDEWETVLTPAVNVCCAPGKYWIEIFNDTGFGTDDWFWETGDNDAAGGGTDNDGLFATEVPGITWNATGEDHALLICAEECSIGNKYCTANPNSTGSPADISASGDLDPNLGTFTIEASPVPNDNGIIYHGANQASAPFGNGFRCVMTMVRRGQVVVATGNLLSYTYDNSNMKRSLIPWASQTRNFQAWFRDPMGGGSLFNLSNGLEVLLGP